MNNIEVKIHLDKFQPRLYQEPVMDAIFNKGYRKVLAVLPRRAGKDMTAWNCAIRQCLMKTCQVYYLLPTQKHAKKVIWDGITIDSDKFLDYIPKQVLAGINSTEMKITFKNGSILQLVGANNFDSIRGTNPYAVVLSEYAYMKDGVSIMDVVSPILGVNGGWLLIVSTPWGKNHQWHLHMMARDLKDWYVLYKKTSEINHVPQAVLAAEKARMSHEKYLQEYECSYERGVDGTFYGREIEKLRQKEQITSVAWEPGLLVYVSIDIGVSDATTMVFWQAAGDNTVIRIIDCYSNSGVGLDHYVKILQDKPYKYGGYYAPSDLKVREWGGGAITRYEKARQLGIDFVILDQVGIADGIENVLTHFPKFWIDQNNCRTLIDALENYYREWDEQKRLYKDKPVHNWASHYADSVRYMCKALHKTQAGLSKDDWNNARNKHMFGVKDPLHAFTKDNNQWRNF